MILTNVCPVCNGNGLVPAGFYNQAGSQESYMTSSTTPETCKSCKGKGYILIDTTVQEVK
jgi:RecJ-like exonuclease